ncbi:hypothetical protein CDI09_04035 [Komagataeibacter nataicola]|uniref:D-glutamate cyclase-like C-terminal domain-containing protein n=2 Tax=Komagataeibacter nataicola TaxID=265960 RepID=A0ABX5PDA7_9PROT|nr:hypothetical protein CDI09_04035 [Komagataeibacter nataicola]
MISSGSNLYNKLSNVIDDFMVLDYTGVGNIGPIYDALQKKQQGPMCMKAAEAVIAQVGERAGPVVIVTGFPEGGGVPETDGPVGAAFIARAIFLGLQRESVIVVDEDWRDMMYATCRGAGLTPLPLPESGIITPIPYLRPVYVATVPKDDAGCAKVCDFLLDTVDPSLLIAIERPGCNDRGLYHGLGGRPLDGLVADMDSFFHKGRRKGLVSIGIGDGGNELGMGMIADELRQLFPKARDTGVPARGGVAAQTATDILIVANVSNWGATGLVAALSCLLENQAVFHEAELEVRCIEACVANGGVDGMFMGPEPATDGIAAEEWRGLLHTFRMTIQRCLGFTVGWQGTMGDWRQSRA